MALFVFENGKKLGEIENWSRADETPATYKTFLGKTALLKPASSECSFISPKPVRRRAILTVVDDRKTSYTVQVIQAVGGTEITAKILETKALKP